MSDEEGTIPENAVILGHIDVWHALDESGKPCVYYRSEGFDSDVQILGVMELAKLSMTSRV